MLRNGYHVEEIANWANVLIRYCDDPDTYNLVNSLCLTETPGFGDYAKEELEVLANLLVLNVDNISEKFLPMALILSTTVSTESSGKFIKKFLFGVLSTNFAVMKQMPL